MTKELSREDWKLPRIDHGRQILAEMRGDLEEEIPMWWALVALAGVVVLAGIFSYFFGSDYEVAQMLGY